VFSKNKSEGGKGEHTFQRGADGQEIGNSGRHPSPKREAFLRGREGSSEGKGGGNLLLMYPVRPGEGGSLNEKI